MCSGELKLSFILYYTESWSMLVLYACVMCWPQHVCMHRLWVCMVYSQPTRGVPYSVWKYLWSHHSHLSDCRDGMMHWKYSMQFNLITCFLDLLSVFLENHNHMTSRQNKELPSLKSQWRLLAWPHFAKAQYPAGAILMKQASIEAWRILTWA